MEIAASEFKAKCLSLMDQIAQTHEPLTITKHGVPVARLVPVETERPPLFGYLRDSVKVNGDIAGPIDEAWDADA